MPEGDVALTGLYSESLYFKGLLDKIGVTADVVHIGDFKTAGETFYRTGPSEPAAKQIRGASTTRSSSRSSAHRHRPRIEPAALKAFIDAGFRTPEQAKEAKLVDDLQYRTDFVAAVREHYGEDADFDRELRAARPRRPGDRQHVRRLHAHVLVRQVEEVPQATTSRW